MSITRFITTTIDHLWAPEMVTQNLDKYVEVFGSTFDKDRNGLDCEEFNTTLPDGETGDLLRKKKPIYPSRKIKIIVGWVLRTGFPDSLCLFTFSHQFLILKSFNFYLYRT